MVSTYPTIKKLGTRKLCAGTGCCGCEGASQLETMNDGSAEAKRRSLAMRLHMNGLEKAGAGEMRQAACIVAIGLVRR